MIIPHSGWDKGNRPDVNKHYDINWSTVFRNASGILRYETRQLNSNVNI